MVPAATNFARTATSGFIGATVGVKVETTCAALPLETTTCAALLEETKCVVLLEASATLTAPIESAAISPATIIGLLVFIALPLSIETSVSIGSLQMSSIRMSTDNPASMKNLGTGAESNVGII
jgi:hypothetical protein